MKLHIVDFKIDNNQINYLLFIGGQGQKTGTKLTVSGSSKLPIMCQLVNYKAVRTIQTYQDVSFFHPYLKKINKITVDFFY